MSQRSADAKFFSHHVASGALLSDQSAVNRNGWKKRGWRERGRRKKKAQSKRRRMEYGKMGGANKERGGGRILRKYFRPILGEGRRGGHLPIGGRGENNVGNGHGRGGEEDRRDKVCDNNTYDYGGEGTGRFHPPRLPPPWAPQ